MEALTTPKFKKYIYFKVRKINNRIGKLNSNMSLLVLSMFLVYKNVYRNFLSLKYVHIYIKENKIHI